MAKSLASSAVRTNVAPLAALVPLLSLAAIAAACSSKKPSPVVPVSTPDAGVVADGGVTEDAGLEADAAAQTGPVFFTADAGTTAAPAITEQATDAAIDLALAGAAPKVAPKMEREGQVSHATLKEGEHFSMMINLMPNRCYTIVGFSPPGSVAQLDLKLYGPPLFNIEAGKSAPGDKSTPVIGKGAAALCPFLPVAVPYKLDAAATKGAGRIGVAVFARNK